EILFSDHTRSSGVTTPIAVDCPHSFGSLVEGLERDDSLTHRQDRRKARVLNHDRPSCGEITGASPAEPTGLPLDVRVLRDRPLAFRGFNVIAVVLQAAAALHGIHEPP